MKKVAIIILNWNGAALLRRYLPSVLAANNDAIADVFVADNGSDDNSLEVLRNEFNGVKVIELGKNYGFAEGYNRAIAATRYPFTVLLNSDVRVTPGWLEPMLEYAEAHPELGAMQPKILHDGESTDRFEYAGAAGGFLDCHGFPYCRGRILDCLEEDKGQYDGEGEIEVCWASGAALLVRSDVYERVGGLDVRFFAHMEEIDLCWRIRQAGHSVMMTPRSRVYHLGGGTLPVGSPKKLYLNFRNNLLLLHKNLPQGWSKTWLLFVRRAVYDTSALAMFLVKGELQNAKAVLDAHRDFRRMSRLYTTFPQQSIFAALPGTRRNLIVDYYLKGKRKY